MTIVIAICSAITLAYVWLMIIYSKGWKRQPEVRLPENFVPTTSISVVIPARNEQGNIGACIDAILGQVYPLELLEIIVVDDHSTDDTAQIVSAYHAAGVRYLSLAEHIGDKQLNAYKKAALKLGIQHASNELIVTTDADCVAPNAWLKSIAATYEQTRPDMIVAPVVFHATGGLLPVFQLIDFMSMQGITAAAHSMQMGRMSNGANLTFTKKIFEQVNGYEGIDKLASGDDYLLMNKIAEVKGNIVYLKSQQAIVTTLPQPTWPAVLQQRIRWASKSGKYNDHRLTSVLMLVYLYNLAFPLLGIAGIFDSNYWLIALLMLAIKALAEYLYMRPVVRFFHKEWVQVYFPFLQPLHIAYIVAAGLMGFIGKYQWKDRQVQ